MKTHTYLLSAASVLLLSACSSSESPATALQDDARPLLERRLSTAWDNTTGQSWMCTNDAQNFMYILMPRGSVEGLNPNHQLGLEIDPSKASMNDQKRFLWSATSDTAVMFDSPDRGLQVEWSDIQFEGDDEILTTSTAHGLMRCVKEEAARSEFQL